jgi:hypothetical protein
MGIEYQYEPEGFDLGDGIFYLPDFYLPKTDTWIEVKGKALIEKEREKIERFCRSKCDFANGGSKFRLLRGQIPNNLISLKAESTNIIGIPCFIYASPKEIANALGSKTQNNGALIYAAWVPDCTTETMYDALSKARQARFEHGETPKIRR